ncbi:DUF1178 family protein [Xylophilus sp. Kf1]|nr:DUF1178 family protein [Xylophilus sp. Kf1]
MKVLDLHCGVGHAFEGWFGSEADFQSQLGRGLVACPMCNDRSITKMMSAPRLNLVHGPTRAGSRRDSSEREAAAGVPASVTAAKAQTPAAPIADGGPSADVRAAWWKAAREAVKRTEDVGDRFAEEARRIHHGEAEDRGIRGQASGEEVRQLVEEGVPILALPDALKQTLQ